MKPINRIKIVLVEKQKTGKWLAEQLGRDPATISRCSWNIPLEKHRDGRKVYYRYNDLKYSINNQPLNETEINQLKQTIYMLNRFKGMPQFGWMEEILARWENRDGEKERTRLDQSFFVPAEEIRSNSYDLSINKYKEVVYEQKEYDAPEVILARLTNLDNEILKVREELECLLQKVGVDE